MTCQGLSLIYDNTTTHLKHPEVLLSTQLVSKGIPKPGTNWKIEVLKYSERFIMWMNLLKRSKLWCEMHSLKADKLLHLYNLETMCRDRGVEVVFKIPLWVEFYQTMLELHEKCLLDISTLLVGSRPNAGHPFSTRKHIFESVLIMMRNLPLNLIIMDAYDKTWTEGKQHGHHKSTKNTGYYQITY